MTTTPTVNTSSVRPSPTNPRKHFDKAKLEELAESVRLHGVLQPVLVRPVGGHYEIVAGERRWRAAKAAGLEQIPANIRELTDAEVLELQIIENVQREDLTPLEEADAYKAIIDAEIMTAEDLATKVGKSKSHVYGRLKLCSLCKQGRDAFEKGDWSPSVWLLVARLPTEEVQREAIEEIRREERYADVTTAVAEDVLAKFLLRLKEAPFDTDDAKLVPAAGSCAECPKRTGAQRDLFPDVKSADACTDRNCWETKVEAHGKAIVKAARAKGLKVLEGNAAVSARHSSEYVDPKGTCYEDPKRRTFKQVLGKDAPEPVVLVGKDGTVEQRLPASAVGAALRKAGITKAARASTAVSSAEKQRRARQLFDAKVDRAVVTRIVAGIEEELERGELHLGLARTLARCAVKFAWSDVKSLVAGRREIGNGKKGHRVEPDLVKYSNGLEIGQAVGLLVELLLGHDQNNEMERWLCSTLAVDRKKVAAEVKAETNGAKSKATSKAKAEPRGEGLDEETGKPIHGVCRDCGCTDSMPCPEGCSWSDAKHTLCSRCAPVGTITVGLRRNAKAKRPTKRTLKKAVDELNAQSGKQPSWGGDDAGQGNY